ncbi:hypothetical protein, conserved [Trypanosoma brucei gambiense DAL972]|uniref:Uncharacterized protein n=1 Tax=Trypanosoma brucei gambiense (strain MHOM/CI/86/DAL972) TaxID=679716 RepID=C9ZPY7_TRYB9|nr:hypothetical protein, conserved [Trypanosoma brucei gambiense DAL972]CBH11465.1 hypothetical protein, conserved [Trypanosoma brucei gambiense DAL972]|eukprot:XP_011773752.1 hypothetical protein, conserved [Trypanosoma brucei gambiense DAL972]
MLRLNKFFSHANVTAFNPWKNRPSGLALNGRPQMVNPRYFRGKYRKENPDDPTRLLKAKHVLLKRCHLCNRTLFVPRSQRGYFHTCCEGVRMKEFANMESVMNSEHKLLTLSRQWDSENERPWCSPHRPRPKGRSKFKK